MMLSGARVTAIALLLTLAGTATLQLQPTRPANTPKLLVIIVVDQMRFDYLDRYEKLFTHGLKRLLADGAVFERAAYPYLSTVTCAGHATIATGSFPATHGIVSNEWWSRVDGRRILCTEDATASNVPYHGGREKSSHSARRLRVPTLGDRLRAASPESRVVTLSMKPRSAVMLSGKAGTSVTWFVDATHGWATSSAYAKRPIPEVQAFIDANPIDRDRTQVWNPLNAAFTGADHAAGERPKPGWTGTFPHPLAGAPGTPQWQFYELWKCSPYSDSYLGALAASQIRSLRLGQRTAVDVLGVSFSGLDCVGHDFGPDSAEVQDMVLRLDRTLGTLFEALDAAIGRAKYVVALSSDHGVSPIPEQRRSQGGDAGRLLALEVRNVAEAAMVAAHGPGPHIASVIPPNLYFTPSTRALVQKTADALRPVVEAVAKMNGVLRVIPGRELGSKARSSDPIERAAALSHHPAESGDLIYILKPYWVNGDASAASHGTQHAYDQSVPVVLMGAPIKAGRYTTEASPADIAPTLASIIGLELPSVDGHVLKSAIH